MVKNEEVYRFTPSSLNLVKVGSNEPLNVRLRVLNGTPLNKTEKIEAKMISDNQKFVNVKDSFSVSSHPCPTGRLLLSVMLTLRGNDGCLQVNDFLVLVTSVSVCVTLEMWTSSIVREEKCTLK